MTRFVGANSSTFPYSSLAYIEATFVDGTRVSGSGTLVGRNDVLTAAHVLYDPVLGAATSVQVEFGRDGGSRPYGTFEAAALNYYELSTEEPGLLSQSESEYDFALVSLNDAVGDDIGWFALGDYAPGETYRVSGYPGVYRETSGPRLTEDIGTSMRMPNYDLIDIDDFEINPGNSGGPVWYSSSEGPVLIGAVSTSLWAAEVSAHYETLSSWMGGNDYLIPPLQNGKTETRFGIADSATPVDEFSNAMIAAGWELPEGLYSELQSHVELMRYPALEDTIDPVIRLYTGLLGRMPDKAGVEYWVSQLNADNDLGDLAQGVTASNEFMLLINQLGGGAVGSIEALYTSVFGRGSDSAGQAYWLEQLASDRVELRDVALAFTNSTEYVANSYSLVQGAKLLLWGVDLQALDLEALGFNDRPSTAEEAMAAELVRLYTGVLGREPDEEGFDYWLEALAGGRSLTSTAADFFASNEFLSDQAVPTTEALIDSLYEQVLARAPDDEGAAYWRAQLQKEGFGEGDLVLAFTNSDEYIQAAQPNVDSYLQQYYELAFIGVPEDIETYLLG
ncbi:DUF4214 domain-containing protein [Halomonas sp. ISL-56]|uniref:DUF4214 domain-containing protein n=1 Tax=Halomonas sp. ISL-56 TaxID=2819149 RepID=UPI001BE9B5EE|nr:DUF4214 domain-containing protein [Halomonas sp. ISL-56]MBT2801011.1 DUF4214 domain-containing protein [Halomonas sp. ISL-56]